MDHNLITGDGHFTKEIFFIYDVICAANVVWLCRVCYSLYCTMINTVKPRLYKSLYFKNQAKIRHRCVSEHAN